MRIRISLIMMVLLLTLSTGFSSLLSLLSNSSFLDVFLSMSPYVGSTAGGCLIVFQSLWLLSPTLKENLIPNQRKKPR